MKQYELLARKETQLLYKRNDYVLYFKAALSPSVVTEKKEKKEVGRNKENRKAS